VTDSTLLELPGLVARAGLGSQQHDEMFDLLTRHFVGVTRDQFERDLAEKDWVVEIRLAEQLVGFTTLRVMQSYFNAAPITAIYSGDTIVSPEAWGTPALARAWIAAVNRIRATYPGQRCFWLLLTSGFRTYRFLPVFWREFYPRFDRPTPAPMQALLAQLAHENYGRQYDSTAGVVRFPRPQQLRGSLAVVPDGRDHNPHIAFFLTRNPGHARGDELVCVTEICATNLTPAGRRMVGTATMSAG
jgi:hypothetical protein